MTFEQAKQQVAEENGWERLEDTIGVLSVDSVNLLYTMAAEKYAQSYAQAKVNEAVKDAKEKIGDFIVYNRDNSPLTLDQILDSVPLPFPDAK